MCMMNCSGGCPECAPDEHKVVVCDLCGIHTFDIDVIETGSFGYSGYMCKPGKGCSRTKALMGGLTDDEFEALNT